jgi:uncharacterized membrane protein
MGIMEYAIRAAGAWFLGFFPLAEIYIAVPAALATGLDPASVFFWSVFGNFTPLLLIHYFHDQLRKIERINRWLERLYSPKFKQNVDRHGIWFVLIATPWTGVWVMGVTAKVLGMDGRKLLWSSLVSIAVYGAVLVFAIEAGISLLS